MIPRTLFTFDKLESIQKYLHAVPRSLLLIFFRLWVSDVTYRYLGFPPRFSPAHPRNHGPRPTRIARLPSA